MLKQIKKYEEALQVLSSLTQYLLTTEEKPDEMKELQEAIKLIKQDQQVIYINGYYIEGEKTGHNFYNYKCIIGAWTGDENDNDIFYYFDTEEQLKHMMITENRTDTEFVVTKIER